jgi:hypothetical protein
MLIRLQRWCANIGRLGQRRASGMNVPTAMADADPILIGHSHAVAIFQAAALQPEMPLANIDLWELELKGKGFGYDAATDTILPEIIRAVSRRTVFSAIGGSTHAHMGLVQHPDPFDFALPEYPDLPLIAGARIVPYSVIRDEAERRLTGFHRYMSHIRGAASGPMYHLACPPVSADDARVSADVRWDVFPSVTRRVSPASLRWKLWRLANDLTRDFCAANDIVLIDCPQEAIDAQGYLRPDFYDDALHCNIAYGTLVLKQIAALS